MDEIELSIMQRGLGDEQLLQPFLDSFQARYRHPVQLHMLDWSTGRSNLTKMALYHNGADVSEVGTTWISDLIAMNALRPFSSAEVIQLGPTEAFLPTVWKTTHIMDETQVWSIPWMTEALTLHYRKDILDKAGIDPVHDMASPEQLLEVVRKLRAAGYSLPIAIPPTNARALVLHLAASWVWQAGGDFMSADSRQVAFHETQAVEGFKFFFQLLQQITPEGKQDLESRGVANCFCQGETPLAIGGLWLQPEFVQDCKISLENWGVTRLPGPPFLGGSNLVIWKHTHHDREALTLVQMLAGDGPSGTYARRVAMLPTRTRLLASSQYQNDPFLRTTYESIQNGRSYPNFPLWGLIEDRLSNLLIGLWNSIAQDPSADLEAMIPQALNQLARSLNLTLSQR